MKLRLDNILRTLLPVLFLPFCTVAVAEEIDPTDISYVSINPYTNEVTVNWYKSESENIKFARILYIYDETTLIKGKGIVDIAGNDDRTFSFKTDTIQVFPYEANERAISLAVDAYSENGNNSTSLREYHTTMLSTARTTQCPAKIKISWSAYYGYGIAVERYEVVEATSGTETVVKQCPASERTCTIDLNEDSDRQFFVRAVFTDCRGAQRTSTSSMCFVSEPAPKLPKFLSAENISIRGNDIELSFLFDTAADYKTYVIYKSLKDTAHFVAIDTATLHRGDNPLFTLTDKNAYNRDSAATYKSVGFDNCGAKTIESQKITPIKLSIQELDETQNLLQWKPNTPWNDIKAYNIWISENNEEEQLATTISGETSSHIDDLDDNIQHSFSRCYRIEAISNDAKSSFSNTACQDKNYRLLLPNAINLHSAIEENKIFKPKYAFLYGDYTLDIYDRNGTSVFSSNDIDTGWDGTVRGKPARAGMYHYRITILLPNGETIERRGAVHLIYN